MPTHCQNCGEIFDLHDGMSSRKWYPKTVICDQCGSIEEEEIEICEDMEDCRTAIDDANFTIKERSQELIELDEKLSNIQEQRDNRRNRD